jgi:phosphoribosylglycinamide formyltransferase-1
MMKVVVFISGRGSNLAAMIADQSTYQITHVISNNKHIKGLETAHNNGISSTYINWQNKSQAEQISLEILAELQPDLIVLAGFMKILSAEFIRHYNNKIINIHPSLLPDFPGLNTHQRVIDANKTIHGATVHFVDKQLDHGQIIAQTKLAVEKTDSAKSLADKIIIKEHKLLNHCVGLIAKRVIYWQNDVLIYNNNPLEKPLIIE